MFYDALDRSNAVLLIFVDLIITKDIFYTNPHIFSFKICVT